MKYKGFVVSHTHWDREWYLPFEQYRVRLQRLVEELLSLMENDDSYKYFMLDGQTVVLEDIYETFPDYGQRLVKLMKSGRVLAGPWYTLPDEFLVSGESFIRNYIYGTSVLERLNIEPMNIAYLPDMFGHSAYIPTLATSLGMKEAVVWRGVGDKSRKTEFMWKGPDGSELLTESLIATYSNLKRLPEDYEGFKRSVLSTADTLIPHLTTDSMLFMNGTDHEFPYKNLARYIKKFNEESNSVELTHSNLPQFFEEIKKKAKKLDTVEGEFRSPKYEHILKDITSSRIYLKQHNRTAENLLLRYLEPLLAYALTNEMLPAEDICHLDYLWKLLLKNQAHDSIGGCSTDVVHQEVETRFLKVISGTQIAIARTLTRVVKETGKGATALLVYNPTEERTEVVEKEVIMPLNFNGSFRVLSQEGKEIPSETELLGQTSAQKKGNILFQRESIEYLKHFCSAYTQYLEDIPALKYKIAFKDKLEGFALKKYYIETTKRRSTPTGSASREIETETLQVRVNDDGTLTIKDKRNNTIYPCLHYFEDEGDAGDEYNFSPPKRQKVVSTVGKNAEILSIKSNRFYTTIEVSYDLQTPSSLSEDRKTRSKNTVCSRIVSRIKVHKDLPRIDFHTNYRNEASDHRLRVWFQTPIATEENHSADYFGHISRKNKFNEESGSWTEVPSETYPMQGHAFLTNHKNTFILSARGLPEYATRLNGKKKAAIGLTLLRAVGWLSREDLSTRKEHAGPPVATPQAQCKRDFSYEYSIYIGEAMTPSQIYREANRYLFPPMCILNTDFELPTDKMFEIKGNCILSSIKVGKAKNNIVVRVFNPQDNPEELYLRALFPLKQPSILNAAEEPVKDREKPILKNGFLSIKLKPHEVLTVGFTLQGEDTDVAK